MQAAQFGRGFNSGDPFFLMLWLNSGALVVRDTKTGGFQPSSLAEAGDGECGEHGHAGDTGDAGGGPNSLR